MHGDIESDMSSVCTIVVYMLVDFIFNLILMSVCLRIIIEKVAY